METKSTQLVTKKTLLYLYHAWRQQDALVPTKNKKTILCFSVDYEYPLVEVLKSDKKSTDNKALYEINFKS